MKLKQLIACTIALAAAGSAHAKLEYSNTPATSSSSSMVFSLFSNTDVISAGFDLGFHMDDFLPTTPANVPGTKIVWDFNNNTVKQNGVTVSLFAGETISWNNAWTTFSTATAGASTPNIKFAIMAGDNNNTSTTGADTKFLSSVNKSFTSQVALTTESDFTNMGGITGDTVAAGYFETMNGTAFGNMGAAATIGAGTANSGQAYYANGFGTTGKWRTFTDFVAHDNLDQKLDFWLLEKNPNGAPLFAKLPGEFSFDPTIGQLTYASPVPVPAAVWLLGSGLIGLIGVARRRVAV